MAAKLARECTVQLAYAIGVAEPVGLYVDTHGTGTIADELLAKIVRSSFDLTPRGIIKMLKLRSPIFRKTASYGHFGRSGFEWEKTGAAAMLRKKAAGAPKSECACCC